MYTLPKPLLVREELLKRGMRIFTPLEFSRVFRASPYPMKYFLEQQVNEGLLVRLKQGVYTLKTDLPSEEEIANKLYVPSYISFEYALAYYNILPEMPYTVTSATTKSTRLFTTQNQAFSYRTIKSAAYTGYSLQKVGGREFLIADPEKALSDYVYFWILGKLSGSDRLNLSLVKKQKVIEYAKLYNRKKLIDEIERIYADRRTN